MDLLAPLSAYDLGGGVEIRPLAGGLINDTFAVTAPAGRFVLQRVHPIFGKKIHLDIEAVTAHLDKKGLPTPRLVPTREGELYVELADGVWRLQTMMTGLVVERVESPARAEAAGALVGRFHAALADLAHEFSGTRTGVHDTARHLTLLDEAIDRLVDHRHHDAVARLRDALRPQLAALPPIDTARLPRRAAHGDLKITNLMFLPDGRGLCLVDLDTLGEMPLPHELGDAWRSWCNPLGEDHLDARFEPELLDAAWRGYRAHMGELLAVEERELLVPGIETIALELAARFGRDALEEQYFGWDPRRFATRGDHDLARAQGQLALARSIRAQRDRLRLG